MQLSEWMSMNGVSDDQMAEKAKVDRATINRLRRGKHRPSWPLILRLREITAGGVTADDFLVTDEAPF
jgi:transcriptional regulator with XRE-family HTH domain